MSFILIISWTNLIVKNLLQLRLTINLQAINQLQSYDLQALITIKTALII
jgi:hypothetical protein